MENLIIRQATMRDIKNIRSLCNELFEYENNAGYDNSIEKWAFGQEAYDYFQDLIENQFVSLAEVDGNMIGYLTGSIYNDETYSFYEGTTAELENIFILKKYRHYGIGSKLLNSFLNWCKKNKAKRIFTTVKIKNKEATKFYKKFDFNEFDVTLRKEL